MPQAITAAEVPLAATAAAMAAVAAVAVAIAAVPATTELIAAVPTAASIVATAAIATVPAEALFPKWHPFVKLSCFDFVWEFEPSRHLLEF